eukprot:TRINITY_DN4858_c1_g1_i2.p1 TRINITY_DN4858_c1_g1~~TRINITY_DN4858_c1_g1_i2.p1  ORF type:complete len:371 (-),score=-29.00 TRINITY_DN4858_c1_g1_i2:241-1353(-)
MFVFGLKKKPWIHLQFCCQFSDEKSLVCLSLLITKVICIWVLGLQTLNNYYQLCVHIIHIKYLQLASQLQFESYTWDLTISSHCCRICCIQGKKFLFFKQIIRSRELFWNLKLSRVYYLMLWFPLNFGTLLVQIFSGVFFVGDVRRDFKRIQKNNNNKKTMGIRVYTYIFVLLKYHILVLYNMCNEFQYLENQYVLYIQVVLKTNTKIFSRKNVKNLFLVEIKVCQIFVGKKIFIISCVVWNQVSSIVPCSIFIRFFINYCFLVLYTKILFKYYNIIHRCKYEKFTVLLNLLKNAKNSKIPIFKKLPLNISTTFVNNSLKNVQDNVNQWLLKHTSRNQIKKFYIIFKQKQMQIDFCSKNFDIFQFNVMAS